MLSDRNTGLDIHFEEHNIRLKWHRLRRSLRDPLFSLEVLREGFRIGASMELDLRVRRDGGFVVLHDPDLSGETTGVGRISDLTCADLASARFKDDGRPLLCSEELADLLSSAHPDALLQFDMKDDFAKIGADGIAHLVARFKSKAQHLIISGDCLHLIGELAERLPEVRRGIDPTNRLLRSFSVGGAKQVERDLLAEIRGATEPATVYLAWQLLLKMLGEGLDLVALCHIERKLVDAWTFTPKEVSNGLTERETAQLRALVAMKPDQITTDEADALSQVWRDDISQHHTMA